PSCTIAPPPCAPLFPYTTLFRSPDIVRLRTGAAGDLLVGEAHLLRRPEGFRVDLSRGERAFHLDDPLELPEEPLVDRAQLMNLFDRDAASQRRHHGKEPQVGWPRHEGLD